MMWAAVFVLHLCRSHQKNRFRNTLWYNNHTAIGAVKGSHVDEKTPEGGKCPLTPALLNLLDACVVVKSTETKVLSAYLNLSPATIRTGLWTYLRYGRHQTSIG